MDWTRTLSEEGSLPTSRVVERSTSSVFGTTVTTEKKKSRF